MIIDVFKLDLMPGNYQSPFGSTFFQVFVYAEARRSDRTFVNCISLFNKHIVVTFRLVPCQFER